MEQVLLWILAAGAFLVAAGLAAAGGAGVAAAGLAAAGAGVTGAGADFSAVTSVAWAANFSLMRRSTGASIVDEADRTNSPMSLMVFSSALLSTPSSLASS